MWGDLVGSSASPPSPPPSDVALGDEAAGSWGGGPEPGVLPVGVLVFLVPSTEDSSLKPRRAEGVGI